MPELATTKERVCIDLHGEDFQAWESFDMRIDGFTVVIGPSNKGKSSLMRAIRALLRNEIAQSHVRLGEKAATLTAKIGGHTITARRTAKGSTKYTVDGSDKYTSLGGSLPAVLEEMNFGEVDIEEGRFDPIFAKQLSSQFLLEESPSKLNAILGRFSSTDRLESGKMEANVRIAGCNSQGKALAADLHKAEVRQLQLDGLVVEADTLEAELATVEAEIERLQLAVVSLEEVIPAQRRSAHLGAMLAATTLPSTKRIEIALEVVDWTLIALTEGARAERIRSTVEKTALPDPAAAIAAYRTMETAEKAIKAQGRATQCHVLLQAVEEVTAGFSALVGQYGTHKALTESRTAQRELESPRVSVTRRHDALAQLVVEGTPKVISVARELQVVQQALQAQICFRDLTAAVQAKEAQWQAAQDVHEEILREGSEVECPACHHTFIPSEQENHHHG